MTKKELNQLQELTRKYFCKRELEGTYSIREDDPKKKDEHIFNYAFYDGCYKTLNELYKSVTKEDVKLIKFHRADGTTEWI